MVSTDEAAATGSHHKNGSTVNLVPGWNYKQKSFAGRKGYQFKFVPTTGAGQSNLAGLFLAPISSNVFSNKVGL